MRQLAFQSAILCCALGTLACSSQERASDAGAPGTGGADMTIIDYVDAGPGLDRSCLDGSDWCVWSCAAGAETGSGDAPYPYCDTDHHLRCPTGSVALSTCPAHACARFDAYCCDSNTGKVAPPACNAEGLRDAVCPGGGEPMTKASCVPAGLGVVSSCAELDAKPCDTIPQECHLGADCTCQQLASGAMVWQCSSFIR